MGEIAPMLDRPNYTVMHSIMDSWRVQIKSHNEFVDLPLALLQFLAKSTYLCYVTYGADHRPCVNIV